MKRKMIAVLMSLCVAAGLVYSSPVGAAISETISSDGTVNGSGDIPSAAGMATTPVTDQGITATQNPDASAGSGSDTSTKPTPDASKATTAPASDQGINVNNTPAPTQIPILYPDASPTPAPSATPVPVPAAGTAARAVGKKLSYSVTVNSKGTAAVTVSRIRNKNIKSVVIPTTVTIAGKEYKVTKIAPKAFYGCTKLRQVTIGTNIKTIGKNSFGNCRKLKKVVITSAKVTAVGKNAFAKTASNMKVYIPKKNYKAYKNKLVGAGIGKNVTYKKILVLDM